MSNFRGGEINWRDRIIYNNYCVLFVNLWFVKIDTVQTKSSSLHTNRACDNGKQYMSVFSSYNIATAIGSVLMRRCTIFFGTVCSRQWYGADCHGFKSNPMIFWRPMDGGGLFLNWFSLIFSLSHPCLRC